MVGFSTLRARSANLVLKKLYELSTGFTLDIKNCISAPLLGVVSGAFTHTFNSPVKISQLTLRSPCQSSGSKRYLKSQMSPPCMIVLVLSNLSLGSRPCANGLSRQHENSAPNSSSPNS